MLAVTLPVLMYAGLCGLVYSKQASLIFFPLTDVRITPKDYGMPYEDWHVKSEDGTALHGWAVPSHPDAPWVLHCHGNGGNISHRIDVIRILRRLGLNVVVFDYRGYGKSGGSLPTERQLIEDGEAFRAKIPQDKPLILYGESLGGGVAAALAAQKEPQVLVLQSTFSSLVNRAAEAYPFLPVRQLSRYRLDTLNVVKILKCPKLIMHGRTDEVIGYHHGQKLYQEAAEPKIFEELRGGHNDLDSEGLERGLKKVLMFMNP